MSLNLGKETTIYNTWVGELHALCMTKDVSWLKIPVVFTGHSEINQYMVFRCPVVMVIGRFQLGNRWGNFHPLTIQWVCVGNPLAVHTH
jgi:hypothetical protein